VSTLPNSKKIVILGGGTNSYISNHLSLSAPAYGNTARQLYTKFLDHNENKMEVDLYLTDMCVRGRDNQDPNRTSLDTPEDISNLVDTLIADPDVRVIIFNVAMVDFKPNAVFDLFNYEETSLNLTEFGKYKSRIESRAIKGKAFVQILPYEKIINKIRKERKDILLVGFKTTCAASKEEMFNKGLKLCKESSANIVFVNDVDKDRIKKLEEAIEARNCVFMLQKKFESSPYVFPKTFLEKDRKILAQTLKEKGMQNIGKTVELLQNNALVTPEESSYWYDTRDEALDGLVQMVLDRSHLHFTRSTVVDSETIAWNIRRPTDLFNRFSLIPNPIIPKTFRTIFDFVRNSGGYKVGPTGSTVGHFGIKLGPNEFLTSKRKTDFNKIEEVGLVRVITDDPDNVFGYKHFFEESDNSKVIAFGAKPSVGGQSQRSLFDTFPNLDCIVHFHCPLKLESRKLFKPVQQFSFECGSTGCIKNNLSSFHEFKVSETDSIWAGHMDYHGPNIVFNSSIDPQLVIDFISTHWDLTKKTTGLSSDLI